MKSIYNYATEDIPTNASDPHAEPIQLNVYCDSDHAVNHVMRHSHTGILISANMAPILWFSKQQNTVVTSTYSS